MPHNRNVSWHFIAAKVRSAGCKHYKGELNVGGGDFQWGDNNILTPYGAFRQKCHLR